MEKHQEQGPSDGLFASRKNIDHAASTPLSKEEIESLLKVFWPNEKLNANIEESKLLSEAVGKVEAMTSEQILHLVLGLDMVASTSKREASEADERLSKELSNVIGRIEKFEEHHQRESDLNADLIQCLREKISQQTARMAHLEREDKLNWFDQVNHRIDSLVKMRTDILQFRLGRERELARTLQHAMDSAETASRAGNGHAIEDALTMIRTALMDISRDLRNIKQDLTAEKKSSQGTDNGMLVVKPSDWLEAYSLLQEKDKARRAEVAEPSRGCVVM